MIRLPRWPERLYVYLQTQRSADFVWGENDCALFAAGAIKAVTGQDLGVWYRGQYQSESGAARILKQHGFADLQAFLDHWLPTIDMHAMQRGDLAMFNGAAGVCFGAGAVFLTEQGIRAAPLDQCAAFWAVGHE